MKNKIIMAVTPDEYELPIAIFDSYKEMSAWNGRKILCCRRAVCCGMKDQKKKCKYLIVKLEKEK